MKLSNKSLKRISIAANHILLDEKFNLVTEMHSLLKAIKDKYRLFIIV